MTVTPAATTPTTPTTSAPTNAQQQLDGNFDTFLQLLTTQLQNQDPLSPMDSNQFTQELVEFSGVEQQINTNQDLSSLISIGQSQSGSYAVSYLGKTITTTDGSGNLQNGQADWSYALNGDAAKTTLTVTDSGGNAVYVASGATSSGTHDFTWNGQTNAGTQLPDGAYTLNVAAADGGGTAVSSTIVSQGVVSEVDLSGSEPTLMVGAMGVPLSKATLIGN
jgi:flagellar basal-body rod modification protein FlgD